jgi:hypothetical protein
LRAGTALGRFDAGFRLPLTNPRIMSGPFGPLNFKPQEVLDLPTDLGFAEVAQCAIKALPQR